MTSSDPTPTTLPTTAEERQYDAPDGSKIFYRIWRAQGPQKALVYFSHGFGEHAGRYEHVFVPFTEQGITVIAPDHRGHGKTVDLNPGNPNSGTKGNTRFEMLHQDAFGILEQEGESVGYGEQPLIIMGHSLGGLISMRFVSKYQSKLPNFKGVIASAPALGVFLNIFTRTLLYSLSMVAPGFVIPAPLETEGVSKDPRVVAVYNADPYVHDNLALGTGRDILDTYHHLQTHAKDFTAPFLITHSPDDKLTPFPESFRFYNNAGSSDKSYDRMDGYAHEMHNDPGWNQVVDRYIEWTLDHAGASPKSKL